MPEHPGFGASDNPPWMRNIGDLAMYYLDFIDGLGRYPVHLVGQSLGGWAAAELAVRNCSRLASLTPARARRHPHQGRAAAATISSGTPRKPSAISTTTSRSPTAILAMPMSEEEADIALTNRYAATKFGWEPRWFNPSLERWLHRISVPTLIAVGQERQAVPGRLRQALGRAAFPAAGSRSSPTAATCPRSRSRRSPRKKSSASTRGHADAVHILPSDAVSPARHGRAAQASRRLGRAAERALRSRRRAPTNTSPTSTSSSMRRSSASTSSRSTSITRPPTA